MGLPYTGGPACRVRVRVRVRLCARVYGVRTGSSRGTFDPYHSVEVLQEHIVPAVVEEA